MFRLKRDNIRFITFCFIFILSREVLVNLEDLILVQFYILKNAIFPLSIFHYHLRILKDIIKMLFFRKIQ